MTGKSQRLLDYLIERPEGVTAADVCTSLDITASTFRGMIRDIGSSIPLKQQSVTQDGRRLVRHRLG